MTVPIWKIQDPDRPEKLKTILYRQQITAIKPTKYKDIKIINKMKVIQKQQINKQNINKIHRKKKLQDTGECTGLYHSGVYTKGAYRSIWSQIQ